MNIPGFLLLIAAPLTLLVLYASLACGIAALCDKPQPGRVHTFGRVTWFLLWGLTLAAAVGLLPLQEYPGLVHPDVADLLCESSRIGPEWADSNDVQTSARKSPAVRFSRRQPSRLSRLNRDAGGFLVPSDVKKVCNIGVHTYWAITLPLAGLFLGSGVILAGAPNGTARQRKRGPWVFLGCALMLVWAPLLQHGYLSGESTIPRGSIELRESLWDLVRWGFGAPLPAYLEPHNVAVAEARGIDFLPRVLTVPVGACLQLAWIWIAASLLVLVDRALALRTRNEAMESRPRPLLFLAPATIGFLTFVGAIFGVRVGPLEAAFFGTVRDDGIWLADPLVIRSCGPLLLAAFVMALLVFLLELRARRTAGN